jgi:putative PIN family toxin of toxin-antitoxin system
LLWGGKTAEIIKAAEECKIYIFTSEEIIAEISRVLAYPKLEKIYQAEKLRREDLIEAVLKIAKFVKVTKKVNIVHEHPADDKFIECALAAGAEYIVSGDKHLLNVGCHKKTQILSTDEFLKVIKTRSQRKKPLRKAKE